MRVSSANLYVNSMPWITSPCRSQTVRMLPRVLRRQSKAPCRGYLGKVSRRFKARAGDVSIPEELELALWLILKYSLFDITRLNRDKIGGVQRRVQEAMTK